MSESNELLFRSLGLVISLGSAFWVWGDSRRLKASGASLKPLLWTLLALLAWFAALPAYLLLRQWHWKSEEGAGSESRVAETGERAHSGLRTGVVLLVGGSLLLALLTNLAFFVRVSRLIEGLETPWSAVLPLDHPDFEEGFSHSLRAYPWPWLPSVFFSPQGLYAWIFVLVIGLLLGYGYRATRERADATFFLLPALAPALVGLALAPLMLMPMISALPAQGLSNPAAAGASVGEAAQTVLIGLSISLLGFLGMIWSRGRSSREVSGAR